MLFTGGPDKPTDFDRYYNTASQLLALSMEHGTGNEGGQRPGITMAVTGSKTGPGANGRRPCLVNGGWGFVKMHIGPPPRILFSRTLRGCAVLRV